MKLIADCGGECFWERAGENEQQYRESAQVYCQGCGIIWPRSFIRTCPTIAMGSTLRRALIACLLAWVCAFAALFVYRLLALPQALRFTGLALEVSTGYAILYLLPPGVAVISAALLLPGLRALHAALGATLFWGFTLLAVWLVHEGGGAVGVWRLLLQHDYVPMLLGALVFSWVYNRAFSRG